MKVLFIGNSFTYYNDMPRTLESLSGGECVSESIVKGGYYLSRHLDEDDSLEGLAIKTLDGGDYDAVVLQDQSFSPIKDYERFRRGAVGLSRHVRPGARILMFSTWAYKEGSKKLGGTGLEYESMKDMLYNAYKSVGDEIGAECVPVGDLFFFLTRQYPDREIIREADEYHPAPLGSEAIAIMFLLWLGIQPEGSLMSDGMKEIYPTLLEEANRIINQKK